MVPFNTNEILLLHSLDDSVRINIEEGTVERAFDFKYFDNSSFRFVGNQWRLSYDRREVIAFANVKPKNLNSLVTLSK